MKQRPAISLPPTGASSQNIAEAIHWQIRYVFSMISTKKNLKGITSEIHSLIEATGSEKKYEHLLIQVPLEMIEIRDPKVQSGNRDQLKVQFFVSEIQKLSKSPAFLQYVPQALESIRMANISEFINDIFKTFKLWVVDHVVFLLALSHSRDPELRQEALKLLKGKLNEYFTMGKPQQLPSYAVHRLLFILQQDPEFAGDPLFQKEIAQFLKDTITDSAATPLPIELMPLATHQFSCLQSGFPSNDEFMGKRGKVADLGSVLIEMEPCLTQYYPVLLDTITASVSESEPLENQIAEALLKLSNAISQGQSSPSEEAGPAPIKVGSAIAKCFYSTFKPSFKHPITADTGPSSETSAKPAGVSDNNKQYNLESIARALREAFSSKISCDKIITACDSTTFPLLKDTKALQVFLNIYGKIRQSPLPLMLLLGKAWKNAEVQVTFLELALQLYDNELINFESTARKQPRIDAIQGIKANVLASLPAWSNIDLVERLVELSDSQYYLRIRTMFEYPLKNCPEYLFLSLAQIKPQGGLFLLEELYAILFPMFLSNHVNSIIVLEKMWNLNKELLTRAMSNLYKYDPNMMNLSRVLDITQEIKELLLTIVNTEDYEFTIPLGILAGKRDFLHFDQWLCDRIARVGEPFVEALLNYLEENLLRKSNGVSEPMEKKLEKSYLTKEKLAVIFENLSNKQRSLSDVVQKKCTSIQQHIVQIFPDMILPPASSEEVEEEANRWFQRVFSSEVNISDLIECMKKYKTSPVQKENEIYACMIHNLLDEYRFFNKYPDKELKITGQLFGSIIQNRLVEGLLERISIKYVFEALKRNGKMQKFGVLAIEQFIDRLKEWPNTIELILKLSSFRMNYPEVAQKVQTIYDNLKASGGYTPGANTTPEFSPSLTGIEPPSPPNPLVLPGSTKQDPASEFGQLPGGFPIPAPRPNERSILAAVTKPYMALPVAAYSPPGFPAPRGSPSPNPQPPIPRVNISGPMPNPNPTPGTGISSGTHYQQIVQDITADPGNGEPHGRAPIEAMKGFSRPQYPEGVMPIEKEGVPAEKKPAHAIPMQPEEKKMPSQEIIEKISMHLNLVTEQELRNVVEVFKIYIKQDENTRNWLANCIVERASSQPNNHKLYLQMAVSTDKDLLNGVLLRTYKHIQFILAENTGDNLNLNPSETAKKQIKHLGIFLGLMTLAKNKPILAKELDLKQILIDGYTQGSTQLQIYLVCQTLRQALTSTVFKPSNPWMKAMLCLLMELKAKPEISSTLALQYEISNMFEYLKIDQRFLQMLQATTLLPSLTRSTPEIMRPVPTSYKPRAPQVRPYPSPPIPENIAPRPGVVGPYRSPSPTQPQSIGKITISQEVMKQCEALGIADVAKIQAAIELSIKDILKPVIERSVTIALITTREIVLKDFAQEPSEGKLLEAADQMVQSLAGSLAMVTCKEPLRMSMQTRLKERLQPTQNPDYSQAKLLEQVIATLCKENLEVGSAHIQNSVILKAQQKVQEDLAIKEAIERRSRRQVAQSPFASTNEQLPLMLRPKKEGLSTIELSVYKDFKAVLKQNTMGPQLPHPLHPNPELPPEDDQAGKVSGLPRMNIIKIDEMMRAFNDAVESGNGIYHEGVKSLLKKLNSDLQESEKNVKIAEKMLRDAFLKMCTTYGSAKPWDKQILDKCILWLELLVVIKSNYRVLPTRLAELLFTECPEGSRFHLEFIILLFKKGLLDPSLYDAELAKIAQKALESSPDIRKDYLTFLSMFLSKTMIEEKILQPINLQATLQQLNPLYRSPILHECPALKFLANDLYQKSPPPALKDFRCMCNQLFEDWIMLSQQDISHEQFDAFIVKITDGLNIRSQDENCYNFFAIIIRTSVLHALFNNISITDGEPSILNYPDRLDYRYIDSCIVLLCTFVVGEASSSLRYFQHFMRALCKVLQEEHKQKLIQFNQRPFYRFFVRVFEMLVKSDYKDAPEYQMVLASVLHEISPSLCPAFAFAWLEIISHKHFLFGILTRRVEGKVPALLSKLSLLFCDMFQFLKLSLMYADIQVPVSTQYFEGCMKITLVISHDFPDFVASHCFEFLSVVPDPCIQSYSVASFRIGSSSLQPFIQLRNLILSALPFSIKAPDPKRVIKPEKIPDLKNPPIICSEYKQYLVKCYNIKDDVDNYMAKKNPTYILDICNKLMTPEKSMKQRAELEIHHALVLYLAEVGLRNSDQQPEEGAAGGNSFGGKLDISTVFKSILAKLDIPSRDLFLNAIFNELRYPNSYTHFFIALLTQLMQESGAIFLQEQILRIMLERRKINPPYPWGLCVFFNELQNPKYDLKSKPFVKSYKEVENLLVHLRETKGGKED